MVCFEISNKRKFCVVGSIEEGIFNVSDFRVLIVQFSDFFSMDKKSNFFNYFFNGGFLEVCCVGKDSEKLHDHIDVIFESNGIENVVTTYFEGYSDLSEYIVFGMKGSDLNVLSINSDSLSQVELIKKCISEFD